jgi:predicted ester cyclase
VIGWPSGGGHRPVTSVPYGDIALEPTGRRVTMEGVDFLTVSDDRIVAVRNSWDSAEVYRQLGLLPGGL